MVRTQKEGLIFIIVTISLYMMGLGIVFPVQPQLIASFMNGDVSAAAQYYGYFIAVFAAMQFLFSPVLGALSDQYGRRPVLLLSLLGAGLGYILLAFAPTLALLFVGRVISAATSARLTAANASIAAVSPPA